MSLNNPQSRNFLCNKSSNFFLYFISINVVFVLFLAASFSPVPNTGEDTTDDIDDIRDTVSSEQGKSLEALVKGQKVIRLKNLRENSVG